VYEKFDAPSFVKNQKQEDQPPRRDSQPAARPDGKPEEKPEPPAPGTLGDLKLDAPATLDEKDEKEITEEELKAAEEKLKKALKPCGDRLPARLQWMAPRDKVELAAKPEPEIRKEVLSDFASLGNAKKKG
jgi:hypothetical protein